MLINVMLIKEKTRIDKMLIQERGKEAALWEQSARPSANWSYSLIDANLQIRTIFWY